MLRRSFETKSLGYNVNWSHCVSTPSHLKEKISWCPFCVVQSDCCAVEQPLDWRCWIMLSLFISISRPLYLPTLITPLLLPLSLPCFCCTEAELKVMPFPALLFFRFVFLIHLSNWLEEKTLQKLYLFAVSLMLCPSVSFLLTLIASYLPNGCPICLDLCVIDMVITQSTDWWQRCHNRGDWSGLSASPFSQLFIPLLPLPVSFSLLLSLSLHQLHSSCLCTVFCVFGCSEDIRG